ncbi:UNVERIFIED_CONTAM: hypothetical protein GTU68_051193 [Idotea baltica]|nr:hypothetical protein [Idotea baltica]
MILGSGMGILADEIPNPVYIPYHEIPGFPESTVKGHAGRLVLGELEGRKVMVMQGRFHYYEGIPIQVLALPSRVMKELGITKMLVTNAAGGCNPEFNVGDLMLIRDHLNFGFNNPLIGDTSTAYSKALMEVARSVAAEQKVNLQEGVYQFMTGPTYETPAEVRMAQVLGADALGMSTVPEVIAAAHCGLEVLGISFISNLAAGISSHALSHAEVVETMKSVQDTFIALVRGITRKM